MRKIPCAASLIAVLHGLGAPVHAQTAVSPNLVREVRTAINCTAWPCSPKEDFSEGESILNQYRTTHGTTAEVLEAQSWLARGALAGNRLDQAYQYAMNTYDQAIEALKRERLDNNPRLEAALGAAIEVRGHVQALRGARSEAVYFLQRELETYRDTVLHKRIQKNINLISLEGQPAPRLEAGEDLGRPTPSFEELKGKVVLLFFWAHWCPDCKAQAPVLQKVLEKYRSQGLVIVAPTQRYGYALKREAATPSEELQHIIRVRDEYYGFLRNEPAPVSEANHKHYGVSTTPTLALVDRAGVVRLYHPGQMSEAELEAAILPLLRDQKS